MKRITSLFCGIALAATGCGTAKKAAPTVDACDPATTVSTLSSDLDFRACALRLKESAGANLLVDAVWWALNDDHFSAEVTSKVKAKNVQFFIDNSGGSQLKSKLAAGPICSVGYPKLANNADDATQSFQKAVLPFNNSIVLVTLTRNKLRQVLERSFATNTGTNVSYPNEDGSFLVPSSNVTITVDFAAYTTESAEVGGTADRKARPTTRNGSLIKSMTVNGAPFSLEGEDTVTIAASSFVAALDINAETNTLKGTAFEGAGYAQGFVSDFITSSKVPAATFEILTEGNSTKDEEKTLTNTSALGKYLAANKTIAPTVTGRYVYQNVTGLDAAKQSKLANPCDD